MKIPIDIPDNAVTDVKEYRRDVLDDNYRDRMQQIIDNFVSKAVERMEQRRRISKVIMEVRKNLHVK